VGAVPSLARFQSHYEAGRREGVTY